MTLSLRTLPGSGREEARILRRLLRPGMTMLGVGANQGIYTLLLAGQVFAFEPQPLLYQQLFRIFKRIMWPMLFVIT